MLWEVLGPRPGRFPWELSREGEVLLKAERGRVWGLGWEEEVVDAEKSPGEAETCLTLSDLLLTRSVKGEGSPGHDTSPSKASVTSSVKWVECGPSPIELILLNLQG